MADNDRVSPNDILSVQQFYGILVDVAKRRTAINYQNLLSQAGIDKNHRLVGRRVDYLIYFTDPLQLPDLRVLVVKKSSNFQSQFGMPGDGYLFNKASGLPSDLPSLIKEVTRRQIVAHSHDRTWHEDRFPDFVSWLATHLNTKKKNLPVWQP